MGVSNRPVSGFRTGRMPWEIPIQKGEAMSNRELDHLHASRMEREMLEDVVDRFRENQLSRTALERELRHLGYEPSSATRYADLVVSTGDLSRRTPAPRAPSGWDRYPMCS